MESADGVVKTGIKNMFYIFQKIEENMNIGREMKNTKRHK